MRPGNGSAAPGFTLLELVVVLAVLALLAGLSIPLYDALRTRQRTEATLQEMSQIGQAMLQAYQDQGGFVPDLADLAPAYLAAGFVGDDHTLDGWGNPYAYDPSYQPMVPAARLISFGPDEADDGGDETTDLVLVVSAGPLEREAATVTDRRRQDLFDGLLDYYEDTGTFPGMTGQPCDDLAQLETNSYGQAGWHGPYLTGYLERGYCFDGLGRAVGYRFPFAGDPQLAEVDYPPLGATAGPEDLLVGYDPWIIGRVRNELIRYADAVAGYLADHGSLPPNLDALVGSQITPQWRSAHRQDPWRSDYFYTGASPAPPPGPGWVYSFGPNRTDDRLSGDDIGPW